MNSPSEICVNFMEDQNLNDQPQDNSCDYRDIPDYVVSIKQEILDEDIPPSPKITEAMPEFVSVEVKTEDQNNYGCSNDCISVKLEQTEDETKSELETSSTDTADESAGSTAPRKRTKNVSRDPNARNSIWTAFKHERKENSDCSFTEISRRVARKLGVSERTVRNIVTKYEAKKRLEPKTSNQNFEITNESDNTVIRRKVHQFFFRHDPPTIGKVLKEVNDDPDLPNFERPTLYKLLKKINFKIQGSGKNYMIIDRDEISRWRRGYLTKIKTYRNEHRKIYYLDESSIMSSAQAFFDGLSSESNNSPGKRLIICNIGGEDGFVPDALWSFESGSSGDYHDEITTRYFEKWFSKILPKLVDNCVIVVDNAPYHSRKLSTKSTARSQPSKYAIDEMAASQNKTVLRIPPYHCELNPIELIWAEMKYYIARHHTFFKWAEVQTVLQQAIAAVTSDKWRKCILYVEQKVEKELWDLDDIIVGYIEPVMQNDGKGTNVNASY